MNTMFLCHCTNWGTGAMHQSISLQRPKSSWGTGLGIYCPRPVLSRPAYSLTLSDMKSASRSNWCFTMWHIMNITLQDSRHCQSKQNSFPHQQDKHARRGKKEWEGEKGRWGGKVREERGDKKKEEGLFKKGLGGKWLIGNTESETST